MPEPYRNTCSGSSMPDAGALDPPTKGSRTSARTQREPLEGLVPSARRRQAAPIEHQLANGEAPRADRRTHQVRGELADVPGRIQPRQREVGRELAPLRDEVVLEP